MALALFALAIGAGFWVLTAIGFRHAVEVICTPVVSSIKQLSPGVVKVRGKCAPIGEPMSSPLAQRPCVWWSYALEVCRYSQKEHRDVWTVARNGSTRGCFMLTDATGTVVVNPALARVTSYEMRTLPADAVPKVTISQLDALVAVGDVPIPSGEPTARHAEQKPIPSGDRRWVESFLPVSGAVWVHGRVQHRLGHFGGLEIVGVDGAPLLVSTNGQGRALATIAGAVGWSVLIAGIAWSVGVYAVVQRGGSVVAMLLAAVPVVGMIGLAFRQTSACPSGCVAGTVRRSLRPVRSLPSRP